MLETIHPAAAASAVPAAVFDPDAACLADALRAACWAVRTPPSNACVVYAGELEASWLAAARAAGVGLHSLAAHRFSSARVVAVLADGAPWPGSAVADAHAAARGFGVMLILDAPAALVDDEAVAALVMLEDTLVVVTAGASGEGAWSPRIMTRATVIPLEHGLRPVGDRAVGAVA
jgi:hypothetical protein